MPDAIEKFDQELRQLVKNMYDIGDTDAETLLEVALTCSKSAGIPTALTTGLATGAFGGTITIGTLAMPRGSLVPLPDLSVEP